MSPSQQYLCTITAWQPICTNHLCPPICKRIKLSSKKASIHQSLLTLPHQQQTPVMMVLITGQSPLSLVSSRLLRCWHRTRILLMISLSMLTPAVNPLKPMAVISLSNQLQRTPRTPRHRARTASMTGLTRQYWPKSRLPLWHLAYPCRS